MSQGLCYRHGFILFDPSRGPPKVGRHHVCDVWKFELFSIRPRPSRACRRDCPLQRLKDFCDKLQVTLEKNIILLIWLTILEHLLLQTH